jgi:multidrug efflux system outer membrane protein
LRGTRRGVVSGDGSLEASRSSTGSSDASLSVSAAFTNFGRQDPEETAASARFDAARLATLDARRLVISEVATSYVNLRYFQQLLIYRQNDLRARRTILSEVQAQIEGGGATRVELVRTQAQVAEAEVQIPVLQASIIRTRNEISILLGQSVGSLDVDLGFNGRQPAPGDMANVGVPADMIRARPDIQRAERLYAAAISDIDAAEAARYPRLTLSGSITAPFEGGDAVSTLVGGLTIPIFSQGSLVANVEGAHARANQAFLQWRSAVLSAVEDVESSLATLQGGQQSVAAARRVVTLNREALQLSRELLTTGGNVTTLDVLDRERAVSESQVVLAQSMRDYAISYIGLRTALGLEEIPTQQTSSVTTGG